LRIQANEKKRSDDTAKWQSAQKKSQIDRPLFFLFCSINHSFDFRMREREFIEIRVVYGIMKWDQ